MDDPQQTPPPDENTRKWSFSPAADHGLGPVEHLRSVKREAGLLSVLTRAITNFALLASMKVYHRLSATGLENLPKGPPFIMIANHSSHIDVLCLALALPHRLRTTTYPIAAGDLFFTTAATSALTALFINALPLWRKKITTHALDELRERIQQGDCAYILFPEGALTRDGNLGTWKAGLGRLIAETNVPVLPCYLDGPYRAMPWNTLIPRPKKITIHIGPLLSFKDTPNTREGWQQVAEATREAVLKLKR